MLQTIKGYLPEGDKFLAYLPKPKAEGDKPKTYHPREITLLSPPWFTIQTFWAIWTKKMQEICWKQEALECEGDKWFIRLAGR